MKRIVLALLLLTQSVFFMGTLFSVPQTNKPALKKPIHFHYNNEDLIDIINYMAAQKNVQIILPTAANAINSKLTLSIDEPLELEQAWQLLIRIVDLAGYSLLPKDDMFIIVKNTNNLSKEMIPLFVSSDPEKLPNSDERVRFLYYLTNLKVDDKNSEIAKVLKDLLPLDPLNVQFDAKINAVLITEKANNIKSVMKIVTAIDQTTFQEKLEIVNLRYTDATFVAKLFNDNIIKINNDARNRMKPKKGENSYFPEQIKIFPEARTNKLIILGKTQAVTRVREFIYKYIDVELESGESVLHVYQLLYLDAATFANTLQSIVKSERKGGTGQSSAANNTGGVERYFQGVLVVADQPRNGDKAAQDSYGSNKLIIAAKNEDWRYIKRLIEQLDKPQPQVILEVLIADLTIDDIRSLGSSLRNPLNFPAPQGVNFQSANIGPIVLDDLDTPSTVAADLLGNTIKSSSSTGNSSLADLSGINEAAELGSTLIGISDQATGKTWGIAQLLQLFSHSKVLSHPHVVATNNQEAFVNIGSERLVVGEVTSTAAAPTIKQEIINANLEVKIKPRISSGGIVNLQISIDINEFAGGSDTRLTRNIQTNANVQSENILALGGLISTSAVDSALETPLLSKIPVLGWLFKKRRSEKDKKNLTVFICPTIIEPRLRGGVSEYTKDYVKLTQQYAQEAQLFDSLRDPITRFFFRNTEEVESVETLNNFLEKDVFQRSLSTSNNTTAKSSHQSSDYPKKRKSIVDAAVIDEPEGTNLAFSDVAGQPIIMGKAVYNNNGREQALKILLEQEKNPMLNI